jgi:hypothetical protein
MRWRAGCRFVASCSDGWPASLTTRMESECDPQHIRAILKGLPPLDAHHHHRRRPVRSHPRHVVLGQPRPQERRRRRQRLDHQHGPGPLPAPAAFDILPMAFWQGGTVLPDHERALHMGLCASRWRSPSRSRCGRGRVGGWWCGSGGWGGGVFGPGCEVGTGFILGRGREGRCG